MTKLTLQAKVWKSTSIVFTAEALMEEGWNQNLDHEA